jgi:sulfite reductase alpha subunit-like flavoprotein
LLIIETALFFGCRYSSRDYIYQNELEREVTAGNLKLFTAFSRDQNSKIYVQDLFLQEKDLIWEWINTGAYIYISGNSKIPEEIKSCLLKISIMNGLSNDQAKDFLRFLEQNGRIQSETWS